ncbi:hypothetical protein JOF57_000055 [Mycolicibacterium lutetiense]|uniref:Uncharacterized protein n=1 Tax=Mycolicibacterium lutetiense TaxID=1641992 RepID=A0ABS4ZL01_9MYCO|nr:hypothetical protein [Mycolicibacterium lutetiense]
MNQPRLPTSWSTTAVTMFAGAVEEAPTIAVPAGRCFLAPAGVSDRF